MYRNIVGLLMILVSSSVNFSGQLFFRRLAGRLPESDIGHDTRLSTYLSIVKGLFPPSKDFILGAILLFIGLNIWIVALKFIRFSVGFPLYLTLSITFSVLYSAVISKESMGLSQYLGLLLLVLAIVLLARK